MDATIQFDKNGFDIEKKVLFRNDEWSKTKMIIKRLIKTIIMNDVLSFRNEKQIKIFFSIL